MTKNVTIFFIFAAVLVLGGWDIYAAFNGTPGDTVSEIVLEASLRRPVVPFVVGVICGHLFWPQIGEQNASKIRTPGS